MSGHHNKGGARPDSRPQGPTQQLMRKTGSPDGLFDTAPRTHTELKLNPRMPVHVRLIAEWILKCAIREGSDYAIAKRGKDGKGNSLPPKPLNLKHLEAEFNWDDGNGSRYLQDAERWGIVRKDVSFEGERHPGRIYCRGDVTSLESAKPPVCTYREKLRSQLLEEGVSEEDVQSADPYLSRGYIAKSLAKKDRAERAESVKEMAAFARWRRGYFADGEAALRMGAEQREHTMFERRGIGYPSSKKRREERPAAVRIEVLIEPAGQPAPDADPPLFAQVNGAAPVNGAAHPEAAAVTAAPPLREFQPAPSDPEIEQVFEGIRKYGCSRRVSRDVFWHCRQADPRCTAAQILETVHLRSEEIRAARNPAGWILRYIPEMFEGGYRPHEAPRKKSKSELFAEEMEAKRRAKAGGAT